MRGPLSSKLSYIAFFLFLFAGSFTRAQLPSTALTNVFPPGGQAGTTLDVEINGADLDGAAELYFSHPGIVAKAADDLESVNGHKFSVTIAADVPSGSYEVRALGRYGMSNTRAFVVGDRPEIAVTKKPASEPTKLPVHSIANARATAASPDDYAIDLKSGQRVLIECVAHEIDSKMLPVLTLTASDGRELARSRQGGLLDFTSPSEATYRLSVHDRLYRGGGEYFYRVSVDDGPHIDAIFPPAGMPGTKSKFTLIGRNLPDAKPCDLKTAEGKPLEQVDVEIELPHDAAELSSEAAALLGPAGAGLDAFAYRLKSNHGTSNPVLIGLSAAPVVLEQEPNNTADKAQKLSLPCEVAGRFFPRSDSDVYTFDLAKGDVYWIEVISERTGVPSSPELVIQRQQKDPKGDHWTDVADLGGVDLQPVGKKGGGAASKAFSAPSRDVQYRLEATEAGTYVVTVRDLFNESGDNPELLYRLSIHREQPDFRLLAISAPIPDPKNNNQVTDPPLAPPFLRKGGIVAVRVNIIRRDGFDSDVALTAENLPAGVHSEAATIPASEPYATLLLVADDNVAAWSGNVKIVGKAKAGDTEISRAARIGAIVWPGTGGNNGEKAVARLSCDLPLAINPEEIEPLAITLPDAPSEVKVDAKLHLSIKVKRNVELKQPLKIAAAGLPKGAKAETTIAADADSGAIDIDVAAAKLAPGTYTFYLVGTSQYKYQPRDVPAAKDDKNAKAKKRDARDAQFAFYSQPISIKVLPK